MGWGWRSGGKGKGPSRNNLGSKAGRWHPLPRSGGRIEGGRGKLQRHLQISSRLRLIPGRYPENPRRHPENPSLDPGIYDDVSGFHRDVSSPRDGIRGIHGDIPRTHRSIQGSTTTSPDSIATSPHLGTASGESTATSREPIARSRDPRRRLRIPSRRLLTSGRHPGNPRRHPGNPSLDPGICGNISRAWRDFGVGQALNLETLARKRPLLDPPPLRGRGRHRPTLLSQLLYAPCARVGRGLSLDVEGPSGRVVVEICSRAKATPRGTSTSPSRCHRPSRRRAGGRSRTRPPR